MLWSIRIFLTLIIAIHELKFVYPLQGLQLSKTDKNDENLATSTTSQIVNIQIDQVQNVENSSLNTAYLQDDHVGAFNLRLRHDGFSDNHLDLMHRFFGDLNGLEENLTISELEFATITAQFHLMIWDDFLIHRYESYQDIAQSNGPQTNQELCLKQLKQLNQRIDKLKVDKTNSSDLNLYRLLDTYGRVPSGVSSVNVFWPGMYKECLNLKISSSNGKIPTKYCVAFVRNKNWPKDNNLNRVLAFRTGVCLPKACDSIIYKNKYELIQRLMHFNDHELEKNELNLENLYCLPEDDSPMRMWWKRPEIVIAIVVATCWILILIIATLKYEHLNQKSRTSDIIELNGHELDKSQTKISDLTDHQSKPTDLESGREIAHEEGHRNFTYEICKMLSITENLKSLFEGVKFMSPRSYKFDQEQQYKNETAQVTNQAVDLRCLEGIKVVCMWVVISGHALVIYSNIVYNGRDLSFTIVRDTLVVSVFLAITGLLVSYLWLRRNLMKSHRITPLEWLAFICKRYLRLMPVYALIVYYCKYISKFTGSGPFWDYGTSTLAHRRTCELDTWLWTLLFGVNLKPIMEDCIPPAWYVATDFQLVLFAPFFLIVLEKNSKFGQRLLIFCIVASLFACTVDLLLTDIPYISSMFQLMPHSLKTFLILFSNLYIRPQIRIPAFLSGLLLGYRLLRYEQDEFESRATIMSQREEVSSRDDSSRRAKDTTEMESHWPKWFLNHGPKMILVFLLVYIFFPIVMSQIIRDNPHNKLLISLLYHPGLLLPALSVTSYILLFATGLGNKLLGDLLSASFWKPLSKLNLCILLIHFEIATYIVQSNEQPLHLDFFSLSAFQLFVIFVCYPMATVLYVLFELPIAQVLRKLFPH